MKRLTISLPDGLVERLQVFANKNSNGRISVLIRNIILEVFEREDKVAQEMLLQPITEQPKKTLVESKEEIRTIEKEKKEELNMMFE